jgi:hypothetical protein
VQPAAALHAGLHAGLRQPKTGRRERPIPLIPEYLPSRDREGGSELDSVDDIEFRKCIDKVALGASAEPNNDGSFMKSHGGLHNIGHPWGGTDRLDGA